jgi:hypothetical protein
MCRTLAWPYLRGVNDARSDDSIFSFHSLTNDYRKILDLYQAIEDTMKDMERATSSRTCASDITLFSEVSCTSSAASSICDETAADEPAIYRRCGNPSGNTLPDHHDLYRRLDFDEKPTSTDDDTIRLPSPSRFSDSKCYFEPYKDSFQDVSTVPRHLEEDFDIPRSNLESHVSNAGWFDHSQYAAAPRENFASPEFRVGYSTILHPDHVPVNRVDTTILEAEYGITPIQHSVAGDQNFDPWSFIPHINHDETYDSSEATMPSPPSLRSESEEPYSQSGHPKNVGPMEIVTPQYSPGFEKDGTVDRNSTCLVKDHSGPPLHSYATPSLAAFNSADASEEKETSAMENARSITPQQNASRGIEPMTPSFEKVVGHPAPEDRETDQRNTMDLEYLGAVCPTVYSIVSDGSGSDDFDGISEDSEESNVSCAPDVDAQKRYLIDRLMVCVYDMFASTSSSTGQRTASTGSPIPPNQTCDSSMSVPKYFGKKRSRDKKSENDDLDNDEDDDCPRKRQNISKDSQKPGQEADKRLACPYYKHSPPMCASSGACHGPGWDSVHRLK